MSTTEEPTTYLLGSPHAHRIPGLQRLPFNSALDKWTASGAFFGLIATMLLLNAIGHGFWPLVVAIPVAALLIGLSLFPSKSGRTSLLTEGLARVTTRTRSRSGTSTYESGASDAGFMDNGDPVPVAPPIFVGPVRFLQAGDGTAVVSVPRENCLLAVFEIDGRSSALKTPEAREQDAHDLGNLLTELGNAGSYIDRVAVYDRAAPVNLKTHAEWVASKTPEGLSDGVIDSYDELMDVAEAAGETHRYYVTIRITITSRVQAAVQRMTKPEDATDAEPYYIEFVARQAATFAAQARNHGYRFPQRQGSGTSGQPIPLGYMVTTPEQTTTGALNRRQVLALCRHLFDPDYAVDWLTATDSANLVWPRHSDEHAHDLTVQGRDRTWLHRSYYVAQWPNGRVRSGHFDALWQLVHRLDDPSKPWAITRTWALIFDLVPPRQARRDARSDAVMDVGQLRRDEAEGLVDPNAAPATQSLARITDLNDGACGVRLTAYLTISADDDYALGAADESVLIAAGNKDLHLEPMTAAHGKGFATTLPLTLGMSRVRKGLR